ncbi:4041_t:CDS:2, partial [Entrophospora sp. SA101]
MRRILLNIKKSTIKEKRTLKKDQSITIKLCQEKILWCKDPMGLPLRVTLCIRTYLDCKFPSSVAVIPMSIM